MGPDISHPNVNSKSLITLLKPCLLDACKRTHYKWNTSIRVFMTHLYSVMLQSSEVKVKSFLLGL